jgi:hypothetical protein
MACSGSEFGHLVGFLGWGISPTQGVYLHRTTQHRKTRTHIHAPSGIRTRDPSVRAVEVSTCLRPPGHWDRLACIFSVTILLSSKHYCITPNVFMSLFKTLKLAFYSFKQILTK